MNDLFVTLFELGGIASGDPYMEAVNFHYLNSSIGIMVSMLSLFAVIIFYYLINSPIYNKPQNWLTYNLIHSGVISIICLVYSLKRLNYLGESFTALDALLFTLIVFFYSLLFFLLYSLLLKHWSINCKDTPIRTRS